jgi:predicted CXXCH cytochrome family protein
VQNRTILYLSTGFILASLFTLAIGLGAGVAISNLKHAHRSVSCQKCHKFNQLVTDVSANAESPAPLTLCFECHATDLMSEKPLSVFHQRGEDCTRCHSFHQPSQLHLNGDSTGVATVKTESHLCDDCHQTAGLPEISPGHRQAARLIHGDQLGLYRASPNDFCLACHDAARAAILTNLLSPPPQFHPAASHPYDVKLISGYRRPGSMLRLNNQIGASIRTFDGSITCLSCHSLTSPNRQLLVTSIQEGLCTDCHDMNRQTNPSALFSLQQPDRPNP